MVMEEIFPPEDVIEGLEVNKVYIEVWRKISHTDFKIYKTWFLKIKALFIFC